LECRYPLEKFVAALNSLGNGWGIRHSGFVILSSLGISSLRPFTGAPEL